VFVILQLDGKRRGRQLKIDKAEPKRPQQKKKNIGMFSTSPPVIIS